MATTDTPFRPANLWFPTNNQQNPNDSDRKIFIAAILSLAFVVVLILLLHLYIRRLLLRGSGVPSTIIRLPPTITITSQTSGLDPSLLATIPTFPYETSVTGSTECAVCLSLVEEGETVRILPNCKHVFHVDCIDMWLSAHCTCPLCRAGVEPIKRVVEVDDGGVPRASAEEGGSGTKEGSSGSQRLAVSLRRMLSSREWSGRRPAVVGNGVGEDVERQ